MSVTATYGNMPPEAGALAAAILAAELALSLGGTDDENCRIPQGLVSSITRQGVTATFRDPTTPLNKGLTGLSEVDLWLSTIPSGLRSGGGAQVFVPEFYKRATQQTP